MTVPHSLGASHWITLPDGRRLHYRRRDPLTSDGSGRPTVVFESGLGFSGSTWGSVAPAVAEQYSTVVYDRAGSGLSDDDTQPRTLERLADDLGALLGTLTGPFILVGHSWGGPVVRTVAAREAPGVRGLVLVDPSDENVDAYFTPAVSSRMAATGPLTMLLARTGMYRWFARIGRVQPEDVYRDFRRDNFGLRGARQVTAEMEHFLPGMRTLRHGRGLNDRLASVDVRLITGTRVSWAERSQRPAINAAHAATVASLASAQLVEASRSGHSVMFDEPEVVVTTVLALGDDVTGRAAQK